MCGSTSTIKLRETQVLHHTNRWQANLSIQIEEGKKTKYVTRSYLNLHLDDVLLGWILWVFHDLVQQNRLDLEISELTDVAGAQDWFLEG